MKNIVCLLIALLAHQAFGQNKTFTSAKPEEAGMSSVRLAKIDQLVNDYINRQWIPGATIFIARNGKIVYHKAYGFSDTENKKPMKKDDIFRIASQTKAITSLAVMMLFEEGKFLLDDPISDYIPEFKNPKILKSLNWSDTTYATQPATGEITIRQLLTHTSGLDYANIGSQEFSAIYAKAGIPSGIGNHNMELADKMKALAALPLKHNPGENFTYGLNCDVLGYLVEVLSGMSFDQFLKVKIFQPLGMTDTYFYLPKEKHNRLVTLYEANGKGIGKVNHPIFDNVNPEYPKLDGKYYSGGAGLSSSIEDYAKFLQLFLNKGEYNGVRLLSRKTVELMLTNQVQPPINYPFGLGFGLETEQNDYKSIYSLGSFSWGGAFDTQYWADPKENLVGLIYLNLYNASDHDLKNKFKTLTYQAIVD